MTAVLAHLDRADLDRAHAILSTDHGAEAASDRLYRLWYHRQTGVECERPLPPVYHATTLDTARFQSGWVLVETIREAGRPTVWKVRRGPLERLVTHPDLLPARPRNRAGLVLFEVGDEVAVNPFSSMFSGGFWHLHSPRWQSEGPQDPRKRLYFAVRPGAEVRFLRSFIRHGDVEANWAMKLLCGPGLAGRRDAAVAYVGDDVPLDRGWLAAVLEGVQGLLLDEIPPATLPVEPGVAVAPELSPTKSFGQVVCDALVDLSADRGLLLDRQRWTKAARNRLGALVTAPILPESEG